MRLLERLPVDEYYQTLSTWMRIIDEKNKAIEGAGNNKPEGAQRRKLGKK
jgi:hypothetical protein